MGAPNVRNKSKKNQQHKTKESLYSFLPDGFSFRSFHALAIRTIYFPLCGIKSGTIRSSITPHLSGDIKINKNAYLTKPVSVEDLRGDVRNFFCAVEGKGIYSLAGGREADAFIEAGMLWHKLVRRNETVGLELEALNFIPVTGEQVELMRVKVTNISKKKCTYTPTFCLPLFGRALANKHDHEHVTSLLNRIEQLPNGVCLEPTMIFDERGHGLNKRIYYALGAGARGNNPAGTFPTVESFLGDGGTVDQPQSVVEHHAPKILAEEVRQGKEAVGALRFDDATLSPRESREYLFVLGVGTDREEMNRVARQFHTSPQFDQALQQNKNYWSQKVEPIQFSMEDASVTAWMRWVTLQPILRRIFGCSFLPDHDYGKGGRGWRDIWQDLLSLILIEPEHIRETLINNFAGVRIDGSNATIIGSHPGEFIADRNSIPRVWMDHGVWPLSTLQLYIHQTGDFDILLEENTYFRDIQFSRTYEKDYSWADQDGHDLKDKHGNVYRGSLIEHILIQHLVQFFNVGEHNVIRLEDADWNDAYDMAKDRGESVAFMSFYGGNLIGLADLLSDLSAEKGIDAIELAVEIKTLLDSLTSLHVDYDDPHAKKDYLFGVYFPSVQPAVSGQKIKVTIKDIMGDLRNKGEWIFAQIREKEKITVKHNGQTNSWFNGYYDNKGRRVEGEQNGRVRMTLAGQVFPIMSGLATEQETEDIIRSVNQYLRDNQFGGIRLNTDFQSPHYLDLGRAFGFAYGSKENGAYFCHMTVMYAYSLYKRGFAKEGHDVLQALIRMSMDSARSKIYPGVPEYFDSQGRGHYHYLTGTASWLVLTQLTQVYGIRGLKGDLLIEPKLVKENFDPKTGTASAQCQFAGKPVKVIFENKRKLDFGAYKMKEVKLNGESIASEDPKAGLFLIKRKTISALPKECRIHVILDAL